MLPHPYSACIELNMGYVEGYCCAFVISPCCLRIFNNGMACESFIVFAFMHLRSRTMLATRRLVSLEYFRQVSRLRAANKIFCVAIIRYSSSYLSCLVLAVVAALLLQTSAQMLTLVVEEPDHALDFHQSANAAMSALQMAGRCFAMFLGILLKTYFLHCILISWANVLTRCRGARDICCFY